MKFTGQVQREFVRDLILIIAIIAVGPGLLAEAGFGQTTKSRTIKKETVMTQTTATKTAGKEQIRSFQVNFPEARLDDLRKRITSTNWPERELVADPGGELIIKSERFSKRNACK